MYFKNLENFIVSYLNKGTYRSIKAKKNILGIILIKIVSFAIQFAIVPLSINYITPTEYGIWLTLMSIITWFALFDFGLGNGLRNRFAEMLAKKDYLKARAYLSTTYLILVVIIALVSIIFLGVNVVLDWSSILNAPQGMEKQLLTLSMVVFIFFCLQFVFKTITIVVTADQHPAIAELAQMISQLMALAIVFVLSKTTSGSLFYLGTAMSASPVIILMLFSLFFFRNKYKHVAPSINFVDLSISKDLFGLGLKFFFIQIAYIGIFQTNNIIIAQVCSHLDVTIFNISYKYMSISFIAFTIFITPLWSAFTEAYTLRDFVWMRNTFKKLNIFAIFPVVVSLILLFASDIAYKYWLGDAVTIPLLISSVMVPYVIFTCWITLYTTILNGIGKVVVQLIAYSIAMVLHIPTAILLGHYLGLIGVIISATFFIAVITLFSFMQVKQIIHENDKGIWGY